MKTSDVLRKAGDVLRERGWQQGGFADSSIPNGPCCVWGAVNVAVHKDAFCAVPTSMPSLSLLRLGADIETYFGIPNWNDAPGRTAAEVMHALDAAFVLALQEEGTEPEDVL